VVAPAQTPKDILIKLNSGLNAIATSDDVRERLRDLGMNPVGKGSPEELQLFLEAEIVRWGKVVEAAGIAGTE
jgi:tripartite-type tricarboxylate transporter receptor subunit TctC